MQIIAAEEAVALIGDGVTVASSGFGGIQQPEHLMAALEQRFLQTGAPRGLTLVHSAGQSDLAGGGIDHLAHPGLLRRVIGGHFRLAAKLGGLILADEVEAYNFPQGVIALQYREIAAGRPGLVTHAGLGTFVDPRLEGGRLNSRTTEQLVQVVELAGREWLFYPAFPLHVGLLRMTAADPHGNLTHRREACCMEALELAMAVHNCGGMVIAQVAQFLPEPLPPHEVTVPGLYVDYVVSGPPAQHRMTPDFDFNPLYIEPPGCGGEGPELAPLPLDARKVIARRAALELFDGATVNLGIGMPEGVASVAFEEGVFDSLHLTVESGTIGGVPAGGLSFGAAARPLAIIDHAAQFDFYSGGGLDLTFLGLAEFDREGNVNVSRFGEVLAGCGGFIEISQNAGEIVFCGTLTASGLEVEVGGGSLRIAKEGRLTKARRQIQQVTFSGHEALRRGTPVRFVTERCVFELRPAGVTLTEIAPGVELQRDVLDRMDFRPEIAAPLREMAPGLFAETPLGLQPGARRPRRVRSQG